MDKDLLRIVIILTGVFVIAAMLLWNLLNGRKNPHKKNLFSERDALENVDESLFLNTSDDDFEIVPLGSVNGDETSIDHNEEALSAKQDQISSVQGAKPQRPTIIQLGIAARQGHSFKGPDLVNAFAKVGLEYGEMQIYERLDENQQVEFSVASMVEPGTFPADNLESFSSPGLVFFMQPEQVGDAVTVFDGLIDTLKLLAKELDAEAWDSHRQPLTEQTIKAVREKLCCNRMA